MQETFVEGVVRVSIVGHTVKIDLGSQVGPGEPGFDEAIRADPSGLKLPLIPRSRLVMSIDAFGQIFGVYEQVMQKMLIDGVIRRSNGAADDSALS